MSKSMKRVEAAAVAAGLDIQIKRMALPRAPRRKLRPNASAQPTRSSSRSSSKAAEAVTCISSSFRETASLIWPEPPSSVVKTWSVATRKR